MILGESLTWKQHINHINKKSQTQCAIKSKPFLTQIISKQYILHLFSHILTMANWDGEMRQNLFSWILLHCKNKQLEPCVKYNISNTEPLFRTLDFEI